MAADIESLIRQALARQNGFDPQVRAKIYQSSRNALAKMIAKSGLVPPDVIEKRNIALENTISKIEREFTARIDQNTQRNQQTGLSPAQPPVNRGNPAAPISIPGTFSPQGQQQSAPLSNALSANPNVAPPLSPQANSPYSEPAINPPVEIPIDSLDGPSRGETNMPGFFPGENITPLVGEDNLIPEYAAPTPQYARPRRKPIRIAIWLMALAIFTIVAWVVYSIAVELLNPEITRPTLGQTSSPNSGTENGTYITILEPGQPGALVTAGNGTAEILSDSSTPVIRIASVRNNSSRQNPAEPILLNLAPGILQSIAGKKATVEILAKSGESGAATFSVSCQFGDLGECGRKRFRIGLQPEAVIFTIQISANYKEGQKASLAISTDVTSAAAVSGNGAQIDIIYARIRINGPSP